VARHPGEQFGRRLAQRSPRLHGLFTAGCGAAGLALLALIRYGLGASLVILAFAEAFSWAVLAIGLWSFACDHSLMEKRGKVPPWFRTGVAVAAVLGVVVGAFLHR
jgi:hypothetical protein